MSALTTIGKAIVKHAPIILTGLAIVGVAATATLVAKEAPKAKEAAEAEEKKLAEKKSKELGKRVRVCDLTKKERFFARVKGSWKHYILPGILATLTIALVILSCYVSHRRTALAVAMATTAQETLATYEDKIIEVLGEKNKAKIDDAIAVDKANKVLYSGDVEKDKPPFDKYYTNEEVGVLHTGHGEYLMMDGLTGRLFRANRQFVDDVINKLNAKLIEDGEVEANDYFDFIGFPMLSMWDGMKWYSQGAKSDLIKYRETSTIIPATGEACAVISFTDKYRPRLGPGYYC